MRYNFRNIAYAVIGLLVLIVLVMVVARIDKSKVTSTKQPTATKTTTAKTKAKSKPPVRTGSKPAQAQAPVLNSSSKPDTTDLSNSGPGEVIGIYAGVTVVAATGHYLLQRKRLSQ